MMPRPRDIAIHLAVITGIFLLLGICMIYPFLPGSYDVLAVPLSIIVQVFGVVGLALVPGGLVWLMMPRFGFAVAVLTTVVGTGVLLVLALFAALAVGNVLGVSALAGWVYVLVRLMPGLKRLRRADAGGFHPAPVYLVCLPVLAFVSQLALAAPAARSSRDRAIANAREFIGDIERYRARHGRYPVSLQAQHRDYNPDVVGIERYLYAQQDDSYDLSFEQPRFLLDRLGTREWVVYNPRDANRMYSHTVWRLLPPGEAERAQGWYASGETGHAHWRYFLFD